MLDRSKDCAGTDTLNAKPPTLPIVEQIAAQMFEIERAQGFCLKRDLLAKGFAKATLDTHGEAAKRRAAEIKSRNVRVVDTYATDEDARRVLGMTMRDLIAAADEPDPVKRRDFARCARSTARTLDAVPVIGTRIRPYAARLLIELAANAERA